VQHSFLYILIIIITTKQGDEESIESRRDSFDPTSQRAYLVLSDPGSTGNSPRCYSNSPSVSKRTKFKINTMTIMLSDSNIREIIILELSQANVVNNALVLDCYKSSEEARRQTVSDYFMPCRLSSFTSSR